MAASIRRRLLVFPTTTTTFFLLRHKSTAAASAVATRHRDPTFEKLMDSYKYYEKVLPIHDLILSSPSLSLPFPILLSISQRLRLNRGPHHFLLTYPHIFSLSPSPEPLVRLTPAALAMSGRESASASAATSAAKERLTRLLSMSESGSVPLRAVFRVWRELGLPDDFERSVLAKNPDVFAVRDNPKERNTHILELVGARRTFTAAAEEWRRKERVEKEGKEDPDVAEQLSYAFKQGYPPGMRLTSGFRSKLKKWQQLPYIGPYDSLNDPKKSKLGMKQLEKRAVGIVHEFLCLTVEKMVDVEKVSQFRKWFGINLNIRDLFLDHPGIFYLSTKGKGHTVFLREAYARGRLIEPNPIYDARRQLLELVRMRRRGLVARDDRLGESKRLEVAEEAEEDGEDEEEDEEEDEDE